MKILFVIDKLPNPPRDGSTIPTFNWISRLSGQHDLSILFAKNESDEINQQELADNKKYVNNFWILRKKRFSIRKRVQKELIGHSPYFLGWIVDESEIRKILIGQAFDVVWSGSFSVTEIILIIKKYIKSKAFYVGGVNDCNTAVLRSLGRRALLKGLDVKSRAIYFTSWLRSWMVGKIERKMLDEYDLILMQTKTDKLWVDRISSGNLSRKSVAVTNGVNDDLFSIPIAIENGNLLFLGILNNGYGKSLEWLLRNVWPIIKNKNQNITFYVVGRGASEKLRLLLDEDKQIVYTEYVKNICDIFKNKTIMLAPIFKNFGLINKVVESMAAGVPVIGNKGSFNGIPEFINRKHGIIVENSDMFAKETIKLLENKCQRKNMAESARELVKKNFSWEDRIEYILKLIATMQKSV